VNGLYPFKGENFSVKIVTRSIRSEIQQFEVVERPKIVMALPMTLDESSVFLVRQKRAAIKESTVEFPAGRVNKGEDPEYAIRRELLEEIGFSANRLEYMGDIETAPHFCDENIKLFFAKGSITQNPQPSCKESLIDVISIEKNTLLSVVKDGALTDAKSLAALCIAIANKYIVL
jgi:ADP-ribose pyrophosphatase